jgi:hypothetical protein
MGRAGLEPATLGLKVLHLSEETGSVKTPFQAFIQSRSCTSAHAVFAGVGGLFECHWSPAVGWTIKRFFVFVALGALMVR